MMPHCVNASEIFWRVSQCSWTLSVNETLLYFIHTQHLNTPHMAAHHHQLLTWSCSLGFTHCATNLFTPADTDNKMVVTHSHNHDELNKFTNRWSPVWNEGTCWVNSCAWMADYFSCLRTKSLKIPTTCLYRALTNSPSSYWRVN